MESPAPHPNVESAHEALRDGRAQDALDLIRGVDAPEVPWIRAVASATLGDPVRVHLAIRDLNRTGAWPAEPTHDVARAFAAAVCESAPETAAWRVLATAVLGLLGVEPPPTDLHLAWEVAARDADRATGPERARLIVLLAALRRRMRHLDAARDLARGAQDAAMSVMDADAFVEASALLADICTDDGDAPLADDVRKHALRRLELGWDRHTSARLARRLRADNVDTGVNP
jgi:hypothetical protein